MLGCIFISVTNFWPFQIETLLAVDICLTASMIVLLQVKLKHTQKETPLHNIHNSFVFYTQIWICNHCRVLSSLNTKLTTNASFTGTLGLYS